MPKFLTASEVIPLTTVTRDQLIDFVQSLQADAAFCDGLTIGINGAKQLTVLSVPALGYVDGLVAALAAKQASDPVLDALVALPTGADLLAYFTAPDVLGTTALTAFARGLLSDAAAPAARVRLGLGTAATQPASAFEPADPTLGALAALVTGPDLLPYFAGVDIAQTTPLTLYARGLLSDVDAAAARTRLALGTAATQPASAFQPADATLTALGGLATGADLLPYFSGLDVAATTPLTLYARGLLSDVDAPAARTRLGLGAAAVALTGLASGADLLPYFTGVGTAGTTALTAYARSLLDDVDAVAARATLGLGTAATQPAASFQPVDPTLTAMAGLAPVADQFIFFTGADVAATASVTAFGRDLLSDANAAASRTRLGLGTAAVAAAASFQPVDPTLTAIAGLAPVADEIVYFSGADVAGTTALTAWARTLIARTGAAAAVADVNDAALPGDGVILALTSGAQTSQAEFNALRNRCEDLRDVIAALVVTVETIRDRLKTTGGVGMLND